MSEKDIVNHPSHYEQARYTVEPIDLTAVLPHPIASACEYLIRAGKKEATPEEVDLSKARFWLNYALTVDGMWRTDGWLDMNRVSCDQTNPTARCHLHARVYAMAAVCAYVRVLFDAWPGGVSKKHVRSVIAAIELRLDELKREAHDEAVA